MELQKVRKAILLIEGIQDNSAKMSRCARWGFITSISLMKRHLFKHIKVPITLTRSAVDNGEGEGVSVLENQQCRYGVEFIDLPRDMASAVRE